MTTRSSAIFDLDGTLTDSKPGILGCLTNALEAHHIAWTGPLDWFIGPPADQSLRRLMPDADEPRRAALLHDYRLCYDATGWRENSAGCRRETASVLGAGGGNGSVEAKLSGPLAASGGTV